MAKELKQVRNNEDTYIQSLHYYRPPVPTLHFLAFYLVQKKKKTYKNKRTTEHRDEVRKNNHCLKQRREHGTD